MLDVPASLLLKRRLHVRSTPMSSVGWSEGASTLILHASKMSSGVKSLSQSTVGSAGAAGASAAAEALGAALALGASDAALSDGFTTGTTGVREAELELGVGLADAGLSLDETCDARPSGAGAGSSLSHNCHPGGGSGQDGSGFQPGGGAQPAGGGGHPGGDLNFRPVPAPAPPLNHRQ